jgi:hypothetical protein
MSNDRCACGSDEPDQITCNECLAELERKATEEERARWVQILEHGCGNNPCAFHQPTGMATQGGCQCLKRLSFEQRQAVQRGLRKMKEKA